MLGVKRRDHLRITDLKRKLKNNVKFVRRQKWKWVGHVALIEDDRTYRTTFWYLSYRRRRRGLSQTRWCDDINKLVATKNFQKIATDRILVKRERL